MKMFKKVLTIIGLCLVFGDNLVLVEASTPRMTPELQRRLKANYCAELEEAESKFTAQQGNLVDRLTRVRTRMCPDPQFTRGDIVVELYMDLNENDYLEIRITWAGVPALCRYVLDQKNVWREPNFSREEAKDITDPEYLEFKQLCQNPSTQPRDILPAFIALRKIFVINSI